jgi:PDZ domain-containing protein
VPSLPPGYRRYATLFVAAVGVVVALVIAFVASVPYVALTPGPTLNTLGKSGGHPMIEIKGHRTYPTSGHLNMVTVSFIGGPGTPFNIFAALQAWLSPHDAVVPEGEIFTPGQTPQQVSKQDTEQMVSSQQTAAAAALCQLKIKFRTIDTIAATEPGMPARGVLKAGDVISAVDGKPVTCAADAGTLIKAGQPGSAVELTIIRKGKPMRVRLVSAKAQGQAVIGVEVRESFVFPFSVKINVTNIGGPSAGLMFALGIIDKLTPMNLTAGRFIAGTGEIEANGTVDPIGGIQQKMAGARAAGATVFLTPAANCADTAGAVPAGMRLIKVSSLSGAIGDLQALKAGRPVPSC